MAEKATQAELSQRVTEVADLVLKGERRAKIVAYGKERWGVGIDSIDNYLTAAHAEIKEINRATLEENRAWVLTNLRDLFKRSIERNNLNIQLGVLSQYSKVAGVEVAPIEPPARLDGVDLDKIEQEVLQDNVVH